MKLKMKNPFRMLSNKLNKFENPEKSKDLENSQNPLILETFWMSIDDAIDSWISNSWDREKLVKDLNSISKKDLEICKNILEDRLRKEGIKILFWDNIGWLNNNEFSCGEIDSYSRYYLWDTDFGNNLANQWVYIQKVWGEWFDKKILLSLQNWIDRWKNEVRIDFPFIQQYHRQSDSYKIDLHDLDIKYVWKRDKVERVVNLIDFLQKLQKCSKDLSQNRKLWIFGGNVE